MEVVFILMCNLMVEGCFLMAVGGGRLVLENGSTARRDSGCKIPE